MEKIWQVTFFRKCEVLEHEWWNTSQLTAKIAQKRRCGTPVSWFLANLGVPSDGVKGVRRRLVEFLVFNSICLKKTGSACAENRVLSP